jgi:hypothetical protein
MKKISSLFLLLIFFAGLSYSCKKDDDSLLPADDCQISAYVDGVPYRWELLDNCSLNNQKLQVGNIASDEAELTISPINGKGSFATINPNLTITLFLTLDASTQIYAADVEIEVTSFSATEVNGIFEGIFTDVSGNTYQVENGKFRGVL